LAGLGRKVFNSGDILLASEVQGYLQDQAVMVFDDSATRATAIGTANFSEGMVTYTKDDDAIQVYDGSNFVGVGSDSGLIHIETQNFSAVSSISFNNVFSANYNNYKIMLSNLSGSSATSYSLRLRAAGSDISTSNYNRQRLFAFGTSITAQRDASQTSFGAGSYSTTANAFGGINNIEISNPFLSVCTGIQAIFQDDGFTTGVKMESYLGLTTFTTSVDGFTLIAGAGNFTGTASVYGYRK
jgi:hypothetical protein